MPRFPGADGRASSSIGQAKRYVFFAFPLSVALGSISCTSNNPALEADLSLGPIRHNTLDQRIDQAAADGGEPGRNVQLSDTGPEIQFDARRAVPEVGVLRDAGLPVDAGAPLGDLAADMPASDMEPAVVEDAQTPDQRIDRDDDGDGYSQQQGDCDDSDASIHPEAEDLPYDGIDQDCADGDLVDVDGDGQASEQVRGGTDCDDTDASIFPGAVDVPFDQVDQDCDGRDELTEGATIVAEQSANNAEVAASTSGQLLLVWNHYDITAGTRSVTARRMTASAVALGPPIVVGPAASGVTSVSAVASNGRSYLVVYARGDSRETILLARSISTNGSLGAEQVVARSERQISDVRLVYRAQHYGVAWTTLNQEQTLRQVWLRRLNAAGTGVGAAINVGIAPAPAWRLYGTTLAADDNGGFLVAWNAGPADGKQRWDRHICSHGRSESGTPADNTTNLTAAPGIQELPGASLWHDVISGRLARPHKQWV